MKKRTSFMRTGRRIVTRAADRLADRSFRSLIYAVTLELTESALFLVALAMTAEVLAPGIVTSRTSLLPLIVLLGILATLSILFGRSIRAPFPYFPNRHDPMTWIGIVWIAFLLTMVSARVSPFLAPFVIGPFFFIAVVFFRFLRKRQAGPGTDTRHAAEKNSETLRISLKSHRGR